MWIKTPAEINSILKQFKNGQGAEVYVTDGNKQNELYLCATFNVPGRDDKINIDLQPKRVIRFPITTQYLAAQVRALLVGFAVHEVDEWLTYKGDRMFDPHNPNKAIKKTTLYYSSVELDE